MQATKHEQHLDIPDQVATITSDTVTPGQAYEALADLHRHLEWGGAGKGKKAGLTSLDAPAGAAPVGTEFFSTGVDPAGTFADRSVVTEATRPEVFEFVTEGRLTPKKAGKPLSECTVTTRYEIEPHGNGCRVSYRAHVTRWTNAPAMLTSRVMRPLAKVVLASFGKRTVRNLIASADQR